MSFPSVSLPVLGGHQAMIYLLIVTVEDDLLVFRLHHLDTLLNDVISIVIFNVFLYPGLQFLE